MDDQPILEKINGLAAEEETLWGRAGDGQGLTDADQQRLSVIGVELDRCYDLLRQRQARRAAGLDPEDASVRTAEVVEHYEQ